MAIYAKFHDPWNSGDCCGGPDPGPDTPLTRQAADHWEEGIFDSSTVAYGAAAAVLTKVTKGDLFVDVHDYGAVGDGVVDDRAAVQAAVNATPSGAIVVGHVGKTYNLSNTVTFPTDNVTMQMMKVRAHSSVSGSLSSNGWLLMASNRTGIKMSRLTVLPPLASLGVNPQSLVISQSAKCFIEGCAMQSSAAVVVLSSQCEVIGNSFTAGAIIGYSNTECIFGWNVLKDSPSNGITMTGYNGGKMTRCLYIGNVITDFGRIGIEEFPDGGNPPNCTGARFLSNVIHTANPLSPDASMGISAGGSNMTISANHIEDVVYAAIEMAASDNTVSSNTLLNPNARACSGVVIDGGSLGGAKVVGNAVVGMGIGIGVVGSAAPDVGITANTITDPVVHGIEMSATAAANHVVEANTIRFTVPIASGNRIGIQTGADGVYANNRVIYDASSGGGGGNDIGIWFLGNNVSMSFNIVDASARTSIYGNGTVFLAPGTLTGWKVIGNKYLGTHDNGANNAANKSGCVMEMDLDDRQSGAQTDPAIALHYFPDSFEKYRLQQDGKMLWGGGSGATDTNLYRSAADKLKTDDMFLTTLGIGVGNSAAATTPGTVVKKMQVFDASGTSLGYVPIYDAIT